MLRSEDTNLEKLTHWIETVVSIYHPYSRRDGKLVRYQYEGDKLTGAEVSLSYGEHDGEDVQIKHVTLIDHDKDHVELKIPNFDNKIPFDFYWGWIK